LSSSYQKSAEKGNVDELKNLENDCFPEIGENIGVQQEKTCNSAAFQRILVQRRRLIARFPSTPRV